MTAAAVLVVTGLLAESRIAAGAGLVTVAGGGNPARLARLLGESLAGGARAVISFGIAGGLSPGLAAGTVIVAEAIADGRNCWTSDIDWAGRLRTALPHAVCGTLAGVDAAVAGAAGKADLHRMTGGAVAVDMESHIAARLAARHGVPFVALRVVADPADRTLPGAALVGMRPDGTTDVGAVVRALARRPADLPGLIRTAFDARAAFASLAFCRRRLGPRLGFDDRLGEAGRAFAAPTLRPSPAMDGAGESA